MPKRAYDSGSRFRRGAKRAKVPTGMVAGGTFNARAYYGRNYHGNMQRRRKQLVGTRADSSYVDLPLANYNADTTGQIALINTIAQGASVNQRVGKKVLLRSLQCRGSVEGNVLTNTAEAVMMIVHDKRPTGSLPAITDILDASTSKAFANDNNTARFTILKRIKKYVIGHSTTGGYTSASGFNTDFYMGLGITQVFNAAGTGAIGDIDEGALYIVVVGDSATSAGPVFNVSFRVRYTDI